MTPEEYAALRTRIGTQETVAAKLGVTVKTISSRERPMEGKAIKAEHALALVAITQEDALSKLEPILGKVYRVASDLPFSMQTMVMADVIMMLQRLMDKPQRDILTSEQRLDLLAGNGQTKG